MISFREWKANTVGTEEVESQIDSIYDKAKYAIKLVQLYDKSTAQNLLRNISTVAPLNTGVYGLYASAENRKVIGPEVANQVRFKFGNDLMSQSKINKLPNVVIKQYLPDIDEKKLVPSDVVHVNVAKIIRELGDSKEAVLEIASTIVHEATHEIEFQSGKMNQGNKEAGPVNAELKFKNWVQKNWNTITRQIPQLNFERGATVANGPILNQSFKTT